MTNYERLLAKLTEMFQLDQADLDFGIYRIMNSKRDEIVRFLEKDLLPQVKEVLATAQGDIVTAGATELKEAEDQARALGIDPNSIPKVQELRAKYGGDDDIGALEQEVFNHLYSFFRRYYDEGDFLSLRRYKEGVYAIPYEGEEVKLHWANADQYYIKTAEHFRDFIFKVDEKRVHFKLIEAQTQRDNNKEQEKRVFILAEENSVVEVNGELIIRFEYRWDAANRRQKALNENAVENIMKVAPASWKALLTAKVPTEKDPNRTILVKRLNDYTSRNTFDYFIHKDLGGFLRRELDFYIKNEVMHLDDIENETAHRVEQYLAKVRAMRKIAVKLIEFLAQIEDFQKKLWLKKKFVVEMRFLVRLDLVPESFYGEIANNEAQCDEWESLFAIDHINGDLITPGFSKPLSPDFLRSHPTLMVDTRYFSTDFKAQLFKGIDDIEENVDGVLFQSDNFHALSMMQSRFRGQVKCVYIDPPYNAQSSEIPYKNNFKHSSWLSLMQNRVAFTKNLFEKTFVFITAIDEVENTRLSMLYSEMFRGAEDVSVSVVHNPTGQQGSNFSFTHEFAHFVFPTGSNVIGLENRNDPGRDAEPDVRPLRNVSSGANHFRNSAANCFYPIYVKDGKVIGFGEVSETSFHPASLNVVRDDGVIEVFPIDPSGQESKWVFARDSVETISGELTAEYNPKKKVWDIIRTKSKFRYKTLWSDKRYSANSWGSVVLNNILPANPFAYPKSIFLVRDCIDAGLNNQPVGTVLDFFAGSGTTAHAIINLNREDGGKRKFILVEMGDYFDSVLVPRIKKVTFTPEWKEGTPKRQVTAEERIRSPRILKVIRLESYEDTLANLKPRTLGPAQAQLIESTASFREDYLLKYVLRTEAASGPSLLNIQSFERPFEYKLKIAADTVGETKEVNVDLVETFNWLLGIHVLTMDVIRGFQIVTGQLPGPGTSEIREKALIIWRDTTENPNAKLEEFFDKQAYNTQDQEFDVIYVNGDNHLQNRRKDEQTWKVRLIEEEFHRLMWDVEDL